MSSEPLDSCDLLCMDLPHAESVRATLPALGDIEPLADAARAFGDPTRLTIALALNAGGQMCGCDIAWIVGQSQKLVSHHLRKLKAANIVTSSRTGKLVMYSLTDRGTRLLSVLTAPSTSNIATSTAKITGVDHG
ncbi:transcriptional regulator [Rhodococcus sp. EPR-157]|jgi:ArsR family transcriptional regulator, lead/cadmium/zinc/bismuth-responsive transcriptional repressor|uniref:ArsR/SmtB family transcription factor n=1 Tax=Rhodococcus sp. EPR-157 TaxID=1813677 RepID=UPI0007BBE27B|nr:metalloregulator ArsR/SmtB family transcription factor [Rhodococcus sp. EPR-157]KZF11156.1 transcriptional regulator [Rhodococcus sp. EPR-157]OLT32998.1 transcriptional regulator [Rhodococcus sp. CUA-806]OLT33843.1 transcriptional regulator [Rhodococcus sp. CUA-806]